MNPEPQTLKQVEYVQMAVLVQRLVEAEYAFVVRGLVFKAHRLVYHSGVGGLVFKAHRLLYHSTLGSRAIKKKRRVDHPKLTTLSS